MEWRGRMDHSYTASTREGHHNLGTSNWTQVVESTSWLPEASSLLEPALLPAVPSLPRPPLPSATVSSFLFRASFFFFSLFLPLTLLASSFSLFLSCSCYLSFPTIYSFSLGAASGVPASDLLWSLSISTAPAKIGEGLWLIRKRLNSSDHP